MDNVLIERLREVTPSLDSPFAGEAKPTQGKDFAEVVGALISETNVAQNTAAANADGLARGEVGMMETVVSLNEADLSLRMMMQLRDRALESYQRILRTL